MWLKLCSYQRTPISHLSAPQANHVTLLLKTLQWLCFALTCLKIEKLKTDILRTGYWFSLQLPLSQLPILFSVCEPRPTSLSSPHVAWSLSSLWIYEFTVPFARPHLSALSMDVTFSKKLFLASYVWVRCLYKLEMLLLTNIGKTQIRVAYTNRSLFFLHNKKCECRHLPVWFRKCIISGALYWWV